MLQSTGITNTVSKGSSLIKLRQKFNTEKYFENKKFPPLSMGSKKQSKNNADFAEATNGNRKSVIPIFACPTSWRCVAEGRLKHATPDFRLQSVTSTFLYLRHPSVSFERQLIACFISVRLSFGTGHTY